VAAAVENPLEDLLRREVEDSPLGQRLGLILPEKIARTIGCCRRTLDREIERGRLRVFRIATRTYVPLDAVLTWWRESQKRRPCRKTLHSQSEVSPQRLKGHRSPRRTARALSGKAAR
jgi:IS30 family transposase